MPAQVVSSGRKFRLLLHQLLPTEGSCLGEQSGQVHWGWVDFCAGLGAPVAILMNGIVLNCELVLSWHLAFGIWYLAFA